MRTTHFRTAPLKKAFGFTTGALKRTGIMAEQTTTAPAAAPAEEKQTIAQKVEALQTRKTNATTEMNAAPEGEAKTKLQEEIAVIDRKLRWYAGRSSDGKAKARPSKGESKAKRQAKPAQGQAPAPSAPPPPAANES
jgi:hypothetical protein